MSARLDHAEAVLSKLADAPSPPTSCDDLDALRAAADELLATRRQLLDELEPLSDEERAELRARAGVQQKLAAFEAVTSDWSRAIARGRDAASARVSAVRKYRQRRSQR